MTSQNRHRSRGSLSILDHIRSLSRTGSRRGQSLFINMNSTNNFQDQPVERSVSSQSCNPQRQSAPSPGPVLSSVTPIKVEGLIKSPTTALPRFPSTILETPSYQTKPKQRPLSWFSISNVLKGHTSRNRSVQLPGKSIISRPILTSTSNAKVAEAEGVQYDNILPNGPTWKKVDTPSEKSNKLVDIVRTMRRKTSSTEFTDDDYEKDELPIEKGIERRRAETKNLCNEKINKLTDNGRIKRKSIAQAETFTRDQDSTSRPGTNFVGIEPSSDFGFSSLTRSFASAVDKLDFYSTQSNMGGLPKSKSIFNFRKRDKEEKIVEVAENEEVKQVNNNVNEINKPEDLLTLKEALAETKQNRSYYPPISASDPEPTKFDAIKNAYIPTEPVANYPRGVNPLRMHTNPMQFAVAPPGVVLPNPQTTNRYGIIEEDEDLIEDAPIYSPSSGDLSQYNRFSPSPTVTTQEEVQETPTRMPGSRSYMQRLGLKKSRSGLGLFAKKTAAAKEEKQKIVRKSRSMHFGLFKREDDTESNFQPISPSPLRSVVSSPESGLPRTEVNNMKRRGIVGMPTGIEKNE